MTTRAKAFPYPVLSSFSNDYVGEASMDLDVQPRLIEGRAQGVAIGYEVSIGSTWMDEYLLDGKAELIIDVFSRATLHRETRRVIALSGEMEFEEGILSGAVEVSACIVAAADDDDFRPDGINPEFGQGPFPVHRGDMIGIGPTAVVDLDFARSLQGDLIVIALAPDLDPDVYSFQFGSERIVVRTGETAMKAIQRMRTEPGRAGHLFMSVYKDCVSAALQYLDEQGGAENDVPWGGRLISRIEDAGLDAFTEDSVEHFEHVAQRLLASRGVRKVAEADD